MSTGVIINPGSMNFQTAGDRSYKGSLASSPTRSNIGTYEQSCRQISSVVVSSEPLVPIPQSSIRYIEVPFVQEVVRRVPRRSIVHKEKRVPKYEVEYVERVVEVPELRYIDRIVEIPKVEEITRHVPGPKHVEEVPREVIRRVPKVEYKIVEKVVEVPGDIIEVSRPQAVATVAKKPVYEDKETPVVVAQSILPSIITKRDSAPIYTYEYNPTIIPVDVLVPKPLRTKLIATGMISEQHRRVSIPPGQYNSLLRQLNSHLSYRDQLDLPYIRQGNIVPFFRSIPKIVDPVSSCNDTSTRSKSEDYKLKNASTTAQHCSSVNTNTPIPESVGITPQRSSRSISIAEKGKQTKKKSCRCCLA